MKTPFRVLTDALILEVEGHGSLDRQRSVSRFRSTAARLLGTLAAEGFVVKETGSTLEDRIASLEEAMREHNGLVRHA